MVQLLHMSEQKCIMFVCHATILKKKARNKFLVKIKCLAEGSHVTHREFVIQQTQLSIDNFGEQRNSQVTILLTNFEEVKFGIGREFDYRNWFGTLLHYRVEIDSLDYVICYSFHRIFLLLCILVKWRL